MFYFCIAIGDPIIRRVNPIICIFVPVPNHD